MLNSGKKIRTLPDKKKKNSNSCVVRKQFSERNKNPYPPLQVKWQCLKREDLDNNWQKVF
jgi:hypothetical protein